MTSYTTYGVKQSKVIVINRKILESTHPINETISRETFFGIS